MASNQRHHISLFAKKNLDEHIYAVKTNLMNTTSFLKAYSRYPTINTNSTTYLEETERNQTKEILTYDSKPRPLTRNNKRKPKVILLRKKIQISNKNMIENIFKDDKKNTRNELNEVISCEPKPSKYSNQSVEIIQSMNHKMNFLKKSINYLFPRIYDLKQKERSQLFKLSEMRKKDRVKTHISFYKKEMDEYRRRQCIDFTKCITIRSYK